LILPHAFAASKDAGRELSLFPEMAYHRPDDAGFFAVLSAAGPAIDDYEQPMLTGEMGELQARARREMRQRSYPLDYLPTFLRTTDPTRTTYLSQGEFWEPNRRAVKRSRILREVALRQAHSAARLAAMECRAAAAHRRSSRSWRRRWRA
jgi:hypothetical protein